MKKVASFALGCKVNQYESEAVAELFKEKGYEIVGIDDYADIYIINTCTVTNFGDKKSRQLIRKCKRQNADAFVAASGCYAQVSPDEILAIDGVDLVVGTSGRKDIVRLVEEAYKSGKKQAVVSEIMKVRDFEELSVSNLEDRTRAYIKIQDGCDRFCSYCIIPYARGPVRSRKMEDIIAEVNKLSANGFKEVVLTGIHVASYGKDLKDVTLLDVIKEVSKNDGIKRIRLSSVEPNIITDEFMAELSKIDKFCDYFHLSLQSGCVKTLKEMNRRYSPEEYKKAVETVRKYMSDAGFTTDIIVGFPGESEEDYKESCDFAEDMGFLKIHVFPFSPKKGTPAAKRKDQLLNSVKSERSKHLIEISDRLGEEFIGSFVGKEMDVLFERKDSKGFWEGHTTNYIKVKARNNDELENVIRKVRITKAFAEEAEGEIL
ncbi:MAG: tRNA (N(6)-L-threonylcarbamoyladenosine(37)-C(2))-methylthiotransferase MtaB [Lachnospiraceae bacterium]|nr:tRNA (N(6)-L-threonylcarbamoyladenosine(37)-C(2))-methylthiotransferase MtaB [Lachnospiraceae bacterium]